MTNSTFSVLNNLSSLNAQKNLLSSKFGLDKTLEKMSSGLNIVQAGDNAAGLAIANGLRADSTALSQALRNANDGIGIIQIADGGLSQMSTMLNRATELATQAASETVGAEERKTINTEYQQILSEIDRVVDSSNFKGEKLFNDGQAVTKDIYVGDTQMQSSIRVSIGGNSGVSTQAIGLSNTNLLTAKNAIDSLAKIRSAIGDISSFRGSLGAQQNRLVNSVSVIQIQNQNLIAAQSSIMDANMAQETTNLTKFQILLQSGMSSQAQANASAQMVLSLFRN
jgi:flagellin